MWVFGLHVWLCTTCVPGVCGGQKRALEPLGLGLEEKVKLHIEKCRSWKRRQCFWYPSCLSSSLLYILFSKKIQFKEFTQVRNFAPLVKVFATKIPMTWIQSYLNTWWKERTSSLKFSCDLHRYTLVRIRRTETHCLGILLQWKCFWQILFFLPWFTLRTKQ